MNKRETYEYIVCSMFITLFLSGILCIVRDTRESIPAEILNPLHMLILYGGILFFVFIIVGGFIACHRKWKMEKIFLLIYIPLSLLMMIAMPIGCVPDETAHLERIYLISKGQILPSKQNEHEFPDNFLFENAHGYTLREVYDQRNDFISKETIKIKSNEATGIYPINSYFPQTILMALIDLFTDRRILLLYAARLGGWIMTTFLLYTAVRIAPVGKMQIIMISLFPMTLQQSISASADGLTLGVVICLSAYVLASIKERKLFGNKDYLFLFLLSVGIVTCKVMYAPYLFLLLMIPRECFGSKRRKIVRVVVLICSAIVLILGWIVLCKLVYVDQHSMPHSRGIIPQIIYILRDPYRFFLIIIRTLSNGTSFFLYTMFGSSLAWLDLEIPSLLTTGMILVFFVSSGIDINDWRMKKKDTDVLAGHGLLCLSCICMLVVFFFLYVWWTPYQHVEILGIQGRYFLPILYPMMMGMRCWGRIGEDITLERLKSVLFIIAMDIGVIAVVVLNKI